MSIYIVLHMNSEQYRKIFENHYSSLCLFALRFTKDRDLAEDIVQETYIKLWEKSRAKIITQPKSYLFASVRNRCLDKHRQQQFSTQAPENHCYSQEQLHIQLDEYAVLEHLLTMVPLKSREIFEMSRSLQMKYSEIAEEMNISVKTVEKHISRTLNFLLTELKKQDIHLQAFFTASRKQKLEPDACQKALLCLLLSSPALI